MLSPVLQDITAVEDIRQDPKCDREIAVYGYLRGTKLKGNARVHIAGVGDATVRFCSCDSESLCVPGSDGGSTIGLFKKPFVVAHAASASCSYADSPSPQSTCFVECVCP